jgi:hypothetical protein
MSNNSTSNLTNTAAATVAESLIKHSGSVWIYLAYTSLLLSYVFTNILFLRIFLILASVFFITFACVIGNIFLDSIVFNVVFILINIYQSIPLFIDYIEVKLDPLEEKIYEENFKRYLSRRKFKTLISKSVLRFYSGESEITHSGNSYTCLYYIALIDPSVDVVLLKDNVEIYTLKENSWVGIIEFMKYLKIDKKKIEENRKKIKSSAHIHGNVDMKWDIDCHIRQKVSFNRDEITEGKKKLLEEYPAACWVYSFEIVDLEELYNQDDGFFFRNSMYSIWLYYTTKAVINVDKQLGNVIQEVQKDEEERHALTGVNNHHNDDVGVIDGSFPKEEYPDILNFSERIKTLEKENKML